MLIKTLKSWINPFSFLFHLFWVFIVPANSWDQWLTRVLTGDWSPDPCSPLKFPGQKLFSTFNSSCVPGFFLSCRNLLKNLIFWLLSNYTPWLSSLLWIYSFMDFYTFISVVLWENKTENSELFETRSGKICEFINNKREIAIVYWIYKLASVQKR